MSAKTNVAVTLLLISLSEAACGISRHPPSSVRRVGRLMSSVLRMQGECRDRLGRFCSFGELPRAELNKWGHLEIGSADRASFEEFDLQMLQDGKIVCLAAFPVRFRIKLDSEWRDSEGRTSNFPHPWREVPEACKFLNRPSSRIE